MWTMIQNKKQSDPAWLANLETTSLGTSPKPTTSKDESAPEHTSSRLSQITDSWLAPPRAFPRKPWLTQTSFSDGDMVAAARVSTFNVVRLRKTGRLFSLSRNETEHLGRFDKIEKAIDAFERATHGLV